MLVAPIYMVVTSVHVMVDLAEMEHIAVVFNSSILLPWSILSLFFLLQDISTSSDLYIWYPCIYMPCVQVEPLLMQ